MFLCLGGFRVQQHPGNQNFSFHAGFLSFCCCYAQVEFDVECAFRFHAKSGLKANGYPKSSQNPFFRSVSLVLALLGRILSPSCRKMGAKWTKIAPRWPKIAPRWSKIAPRWPKIAQHSLQEEPQDPKKPSKVLYSRRFFGFRHFWQDRVQDAKKVAKMLPKVRQVGHLRLQVGHLGHILAPSWATQRHLGSNLGDLGAKMGSKRQFVSQFFAYFCIYGARPTKSYQKDAKSYQKGAIFQ